MFGYSFDGKAFYGPYDDEVEAGLATIEKLKENPDATSVTIRNDDTGETVVYGVERSQEGDRTVIVLTEV